MKHFHPEELALLAAIHAEPREDTPRLVYADWLQEHDQPDFAEFIRLQVESRRNEVPTQGQPRWWSTAGSPSRRESELLNDRASGWSQPLTRETKLVGWFRGLPVISFRERLVQIEVMDKTMNKVTPRGRIVLELWPSNRSTAFQQPGSRINDRVGHSILSRVSFIHLYSLDDWSEEELQCVLTTPYLSRLESVMCRGSQRLLDKIAQRLDPSQFIQEG